MQVFVTSSFAQVIFLKIKWTTLVQTSTNRRGLYIYFDNKWYKGFAKNIFKKTKSRMQSVAVSC